MAKRGRKPKTYKEGYFYQKEEDAVMMYIQSDSAEEKNRIFEEILRPAFKRMIESIIRRYKLYPKGEDFQTTFSDALAFIISKMVKYKQENGRAYSYIQTICKNHLIGKINEQNKTTLRSIPYEDLLIELDEDEKFVYEMDEDTSETNDLILAVIEEINTLISKENNKLNKNEILVGRAISQMLENWDELFVNIGSNKFNKSSILLYIKEATNLPVKDITNSMRKYKALYYKTKQISQNLD